MSFIKKHIFQNNEINFKTVVIIKEYTQKIILRLYYSNYTSFLESGVFLNIDNKQKELLKEIDEKVYMCNCCKNLVEKFPNEATVFLGKDHTLVLVGEAPANNGWRKSHMLWRDEKGKILPSGVVLQKLFSIINRDIFETTFLESVKCYPLSRKNLKVCSHNCKYIMFEQLRILKPELIITLGEFPTRNLLDFNFKKYSDVVGKIYEVNGFRILPIYHPSPISPKSYNGNIPIFEKLKKDGI